MSSPFFTQLDDPFIMVQRVEHVVEVDEEWLDDIIELVDNEEPSSNPPTLHPPAAVTPSGQELIFGSECDEPTVVYPRGYVEALLAEASAHTHGTVRAMKAVTPESTP